jgi:hypothetical protein
MEATEGEAWPVMVTLSLDTPQAVLMVYLSLVAPAAPQVATAPVPVMLVPTLVHVPPLWAVVRVAVAPTQRSVMLLVMVAVAGAGFTVTDFTAVPVLLQVFEAE